MPGIFGFFGNLGDRKPVTLLETMSHALKDEEWYHVQTYQNGNIGLGRITLGLGNLDPQPIWNAQRTICIVMEGEIYNAQDLRNELLKSDNQPLGASDAELILNLYEQVGEDFARNLNGAFVLAIWDRLAHKLVIANDRLGLYPLFYHVRNGFLMFASGVRGLLADPDMPRVIDKVAMAEFLTFQHVLGDRTYLEDVHFLPGASLLTFCEGKFKLSPYWKMKFADAYQPLDEQDYREPLLHHLRKAIARRNADNLPAGILLSGGLDSRVLLGLLSEDRPEKRIHTFTWGVPGCDDARYAEEASRVAKAQHHFYELKPDYLLDMAEKSVRLTDGLGNVINLHARATLEQEIPYAKVIYKGFMGDALMGYGLSYKYWAQFAPQQVKQDHFRVHRAQKFLVFDLVDHPRLFRSEFQRQIDGEVFRAYSAALDESEAGLLVDQRHYFDLRQRVPRMTVQGVEVVRSRAIVRLPFCDNDLVEFMLTVPPWLRIERTLMKRAFIHAFPRLAQVPYTETGLPMTECARELSIRLQRFLSWHLYKIGLRQSPHIPRRSYARYDDWFRTVLRSWMEKLLFEKRTLERGYFNPDYIRTLLEEHMAGARHAAKLGALITLELWHRQFID